ncbi:hypothetical protein [Bradyrhizobium sp. 27S5]|uniref:hypothetical protein n=1 Tax=Bradyrhizobium sp. 27S5 TaxID=3139728 RepID=UPI0030D39BB1
MDQIKLRKHIVDAIERRLNRANQPARLPSTDEQFARLRVHQSNIRRYRRLLQTHLTEVERRFIEKRLAEESIALQRSLESGVPIARIRPARQAAPSAAMGEHRYE